MAQGEELTFEAGNAVDMPFSDGAFDIATQLHVGMNIVDKAGLFADMTLEAKATSDD